MLDRRKLEALGFLDEQNFFLDNSDHDLFARAWHQHKWICGYVPINFETRLADGFTRKQRDALNTFFLEQRKQRAGRGFYHLHQIHYQPRRQIFISLVDGTQIFTKLSLKLRVKSALRPIKVFITRIWKGFTSD